MPQVRLPRQPYDPNNGRIAPVRAGGGGGFLDGLFAPMPTGQTTNVGGIEVPIMKGGLIGLAGRRATSQNIQQAIAESTALQARIKTIEAQTDAAIKTAYQSHYANLGLNPEQVEEASNIAFNTYKNQQARLQAEANLGETQAQQHKSVLDATFPSTLSAAKYSTAGTEEQAHAGAIRAAGELAAAPAEAQTTLTKAGTGLTGAKTAQELGLEQAREIPLTEEAMRTEAGLAPYSIRSKLARESLMPLAPGITYANLGTGNAVRMPSSMAQQAQEMQNLKTGNMPFSKVGTVSFGGGNTAGTITLPDGTAIQAKSGQVNNQPFGSILPKVSTKPLPNPFEDNPQKDNLGPLTDEEFQGNGMLSPDEDNIGSANAITPSATPKPQDQVNHDLLPVLGGGAMLLNKVLSPVTPILNAGARMQGLPSLPNIIDFSRVAGAGSAMAPDVLSKLGNYLRNLYSQPAESDEDSTNP